MCYAIPGKVIELKNNIAIIDYFGDIRNVLNEHNDIKIGDYIYAQGGILLNKISKEEAEKTLIVWEDKFFELKEIDKKLSSIENKSDDENLLSILQKVNLKKELNKNEMLYLLKIEDDESLKLIYNFANNLRQKEHDNASCIHGILEFSNYCKNDCAYCGIRKSQIINRYRLDVDTIISNAKYAIETFGFKALVFQSGEDFFYDDEKLIKIVREIKKSNILIFLSIGIRSVETYQKLYDAGARAVLIRFETSNEEIFKKIRPNTDFNERINLIKKLKKMGYVIATGFLAGLPNETNEDIVNNILLTKELKADMYSFGPFIPTPKTPMENENLISQKMMLKIIAITRFVDRNSNILVTSALETLNKDAKKNGLMAGANSLMINITPPNYKKLYELYPGKNQNQNSVKENIDEVIDLLYSIGRAPTDLGN